MMKNYRMEEKTLPMEKLKFSCPHCGIKLNAPPDWLGSIIECPKCRRDIRLDRNLLSQQQDQQSNMSRPNPYEDPYSGNPYAQRNRWRGYNDEQQRYKSQTGCGTVFFIFLLIAGVLGGLWLVNPNLVEGWIPGSGASHYNAGVKQFKKYEYAEAIKCLREGAEKGNGDAQALLGCCYMVGMTDIPQDSVKAIFWLRQAAEQNNPAGLVMLGMSYEKGILSTQDTYKADELFKKGIPGLLKSAERGDFLSQFLLGLAYLTGNGVFKNGAKAELWLKKAAEQDFVWAQLGLAAEYKKGTEIPKNESEAVRWVKKAAELGNAEAQYLLGECFSDGSGVTANQFLAFNWYRKAAEQGLAEAQIKLGECYQKGYGTEKDYDQALNWYRKAAEQGDAEAQFRVAGSYLENFQTFKNAKEFLYWCQKSANQGHAKALLMMGIYYLHQENNKYEAEIWFSMSIRGLRRLSDDEDDEAKVLLGLCYIGGWGVEKNATYGVSLFRAAANRGNDVAQYMLGMCYEHGTGVVSRDIYQAREWYRKAANQGNQAAKDALRRL